MLFDGGGGCWVRTLARMRTSLHRLARETVFIISARSRFPYITLLLLLLLSTQPPRSSIQFIHACTVGKAATTLMNSRITISFSFPDVFGITFTFSVMV